jgi:hypothetical protein
MTNHFTIQRNRTTGDYEVVAIGQRRRIIVATNLRTRSHAEASRNWWRTMTAWEPDQTKELITCTRTKNLDLT